MKKTRLSLLSALKKTCLLTTVSVCFSLSLSAGADAAVNQSSSLVVTNSSLPPALERELYIRSFTPTTIRPEEVAGDNYFTPTRTPVGKKIELLRADMFDLQKKIAAYSEQLSVLENSVRQQAALYHSSVATINTRLQVGTTPGNPRLIGYLNTAQKGLDDLSVSLNQLNDLALDVSESESLTSFLLGSVRATFNLTGAVEEDHIHLSQLEEALNNTSMVIDRLSNNINDHMLRTSTYLRSENANIRALAMAVRAGDPMGRSLSNLPFSTAQPVNFAPARDQGAMGAATASQGGAALAPMPQQMTSAPATPRPLVKIRFDHSNVDYERPVYMAVNEALNRYPGAQFELVAVHPDSGNGAKQAIENTRARRYAEKVLRSMSDMGVPMERINLSHTPSADAQTSEVHIYIH